MKNKTTIKMLVVALLTLLPATQTWAQDWKSVLSGVADAVGKKASDKLAEKHDVFTVSGTWKYAKPDCKFESEDMLSKAGGELAAKKVEQQMSDVMTKLGIDENTVFTFNNDSTYTMRTSTRTMQGTYSLNKETREIVMTSKFRFHFTAKVERNLLKPNSMSLLFKADKLMNLAQTLTGALAKKSANKTISAASSLLGKYDGMNMGFELIKPGTTNQSILKQN